MFSLKLKEREKRAEYLDFDRDLKKMEHESDCDTNCNRCARIDRENERVGRVETIQTTLLLRSTRILKRVWKLEELAVIQTPMRKHQLVVV